MAPIPGERSTTWIDRRRAIAAQPFDDGLRIRYALDWERSGLVEDRARLIRVQMRLAEMAEGEFHPEWAGLNRQARALVRRNVPAWAPAWFEHEGVTGVEYHRGFIEMVSTPAAVLLNPDLRRRLMTDEPVRHLTVTGIGSEDEFARIVLAPEMVGLASLRVDGQGLGDDSMRVLASSPLRTLRWLSLAWNRIGAVGVAALAESAVGRGLLFAEFVGNPGDPIERFETDLGIVVSRRLPAPALALQEEFGPLPWLHRGAAPPNRLSMAVARPA